MTEATKAAEPEKVKEDVPAEEKEENKTEKDEKKEEKDEMKCRCKV